MLTAIYALILIACSSILGLFGFFVGRCARKLPVIDNHLPWALSWALHRGQIPHTDQNSRPAPASARWPRDCLCELLTRNARDDPVRHGHSDDIGSRRTDRLDLSDRSSQHRRPARRA